MGVINLEDLQPGMVLAEDARHLNGRILLNSGTELTEKHIHIFKSWGLMEASIEGITKEEINAKSIEHISPEILKEAEEEIRRRFCHTELTHPFVADLFQLCVRLFTEHKARSLKNVDSRETG